MLPATPFDYTFRYRCTSQAANLAGADNTPANNLATDAGATLGRVLFHDKNFRKTIRSPADHAIALWYF
ncbi:MAG: hypothetical protein R3B47_03070 [Bacteroidia bacterium]